MDPEQEALATLQSIVELIVDHPEKVLIQGFVQNDGTIFVVTPGAGDLGMLIGRSGRTARAIRTILACAGRKHGTRYGLDLCQKKCSHCGCTDEMACQTVSGNCHWISDFLPSLVCSNPKCIAKEIERRAGDAPAQPLKATAHA